MAKVAIPFYCIKTKKSYKAGEEYKGKRTDLGPFMVGYKPKETKELKPKLEKK